MAIFPNMVGNVWRGQITIPSNAGTGANVLALMRTAGYRGPASVAVKLLGATAAGASRAAFGVATPRADASAVVATDFTTHGQTVLAGADYFEPSDGDAAISSVRSLDGSTVAAQVVACW